ncbi:uncharacterized protein METZ01_LOCUS333738 [marine metagenome]|uniref:Uncharacterized protein n=1 Tax=marine metagenome TaxID=408172 RepID=A0A382Q5L0_9ZZZZ
MKNILARGGIEFIAVLLGITGSLWIDENRKAYDQNKKQITILEAVYEDIIQTENFIKNRRTPAFKADSTWMDFFADNWENMNVDSVAIELSKHGTRVSFHNTFLDFREFHPPISSIELIMQDGSLKEIHNIEIRKKINKLVKTDLAFVLKNVQTEIDMQIDFRNTLINQNDAKLGKILSISQSELKDRFRDNVVNYDKQIEQLKYFLTKDYVRTYISLKNRHRYFVMLFINQFKNTLSELKTLVQEELELANQ